MSLNSGVRTLPRDLDTVPFKANSAEQAVQLIRRRKAHMVYASLTAEVTVATPGGAPTTLTEGVAGLVDRALHRFLSNQRLPFDLNGRELLDVSRRLSAQQLTLDDGGFDPAAAATYSLQYDFLLPWNLAFMAVPFEGHARATTPEEINELAFQYSSAKNKNTDGDGTAELVQGGTQDLTWQTEPSIELVEEVGKPGPLPVYIPQIKRYTGNGTFTGAQDDYRIPLETTTPILALIVRAFDVGTGEPDDVITHVSVGDMEDFRETPISGLRIREQKDFPAVDSTITGSVGILLADGGKWSNRVLPRRDFDKREVKVNVSAPTDGDETRVDVLAIHALRTNAGRDVRRNL